MTFHELSVCMTFHELSVCMTFHELSVCMTFHELSVCIMPRTRVPSTARKAVSTSATPYRAPYPRVLTARPNQESAARHELDYSEKKCKLIHEDYFGPKNFNLWQNFIGTNVLTKFHEDWPINEIVIFSQNHEMSCRRILLISQQSLTLTSSTVAHGCIIQSSRRSFILYDK
ncbi:hypothetical protein DPMN_183104 [Dreissena polymorpha]|uniref:Uncharacterized protein n=1 Tax=Dreissena polymorpha TaxID=45954 RepID=A0A9D4DIG0_DREPO|nr:hypothetical protein DPMN_183104 [Dreissena polymorpha]